MGKLNKVVIRYRNALIFFKSSLDYRISSVDEQFTGKRKGSIGIHQGGGFIERMCVRLGALNDVR